MKTLLPVGLVAIALCVGLGWWLGGESLAPAPHPAATQPSSQVSQAPPALAVNTVLTSRPASPPTWIPSDAERRDDPGPLLRWVPTDAERKDDRGASLKWTPSDAERADDRGASLVWTATDAERDDDVGIVVRGSDRSR